MDMDYTPNEKELERRRLIRLEMKRKQRRQKQILMGVGAAALLLLVIFLFRGCSNRRAEKQTQAEKEAANAAVQTEAAGIKATISAVGDIMCYENQMVAAQKEDGSYDFAPAFAAIKPYLEGANLTVGNLELNFCGAEAGYEGFPRFKAPESLATALKNAGFDLLQTANTYSIQNGINGLNSTIAHLTAQGLDHLGTYHTPEAKADHQGVIIKNVNGIRIAFFAYTKGMNNMSLPEDYTHSVDVLYTDYSSNYSEINTDALLRSIKAAKDSKADVIVAMLHWGNEYELEPTQSQNEIADFLFSNGVDVILGSHSHEVGPMEMRTVTVDGREKNVFLAYSLGNFFSSMTEGSSQASVILNLEFTMDAETGETTISKVDYTPVYLVDKGEGTANRYEILPVRSALSSSAFANETDALNGVITTLKNNTGSDLDSGK